MDPSAAQPTSADDSARRHRFLSARWTDLLLLTWPVPESLLQDRLPPGCTLDRWEGQACASLVVFDFMDTRVWGIPWPGFRYFPEWNLRFYVRYGEGTPAERRGVVFIREYVPKRLVAGLARLLFNEAYFYAPMRRALTRDAAGVAAEHRLKRDGRWHTVRWSSDNAPYRPAADSAEHHFKEHEWGFVGDGRGGTTMYRVEHPHWDVYPVREHTLELNLETLYGAEWAAVLSGPPLSVVHAAGSPVTVYKGQPAPPLG